MITGKIDINTEKTTPKVNAKPSDQLSYIRVNSPPYSTVNRAEM